MASSPDTHGDSIAYFTRGEHSPTLEYLDTICQKLWGSEARVGPEGDIYYITYRDLAKPQSGLLPVDYVLVSRVSGHADIYAQHSQYEHFKELRINTVKKDGGSVEAAIRAVDYILEGERGRETLQAVQLGKRAHELLDLFSGGFSAVSDEGFAEAQVKTYELLRKAHLDPDRVFNEEKQRISDWLMKASSGQDSQGRKNQLITVMALQAAYRHAIEKRKGIGLITRKFVAMREALIFERERDRDILESGMFDLHHNAISRIRNDTPTLLKQLRALRYRLTLPLVKPYRPIGLQAEEMVTKTIRLLESGDFAELDASGLIPRVHTLLLDKLEEHRSVYHVREK